MVRALRKVGLADHRGELQHVMVALWLDDDGNVMVQVEKPKSIAQARAFQLATAPAKRRSM